MSDENMDELTEDMTENQKIIISEVDYLRNHVALCHCASTEDLLMASGTFLTAAFILHIEAIGSPEEAVNYLNQLLNILQEKAPLLQIQKITNAPNNKVH